MAFIFDGRVSQKNAGLDSAGDVRSSGVHFRRTGVEKERMSAQEAARRRRSTTAAPMPSAGGGTARRTSRPRRSASRSRW